MPNDRSRHISLFPASGKILLLILVLALARHDTALASTLQEHTAQAFSRYASGVEDELEKRAAGELSFLRLEEYPAGMARVKRGEIKIENLNKDDNTPDGIIHDWVGDIFMPDSTIEEVIHILTDYDSHKSIFDEVIESRLIEKSGSHLKSYLRFKKKEIITVVTDTWYQAEHRFYPGARAQLISRSTRINEVENFGSPGERLKPEGEDNGFLWRMNTYWSLRESSDGVVLECRSVSLSRDIPLGLNLIIKPIVNRMPRKSLEKTLETLKQLTIDD